MKFTCQHDLLLGDLPDGFARLGDDFADGFHPLELGAIKRVHGFKGRVMFDRRPVSLGTVSGTNEGAGVVDAVTTAFKNGHKVQFCGNGGSAADAQHLAAEFSGRFYKNRKALPSDALHCNSSYLTAVANDYGYDEVYSRLVDGSLS